MNKQSRDVKMDLTNEKKRDMFRKMVLIRSFEFKVKELFKVGKIPGFLDLYIGEEAVAVGVCSALKEQDYITSTHRGHGHVIAKGARLNKMMAELFAKRERILLNCWKQRRARLIEKVKNNSLTIDEINEGSHTISILVMM